MEITTPPLSLRNRCELRAIILAWSGWATSANTTSTIPINILIHNTFWSDNVSNVRNRGTGSCSQIENFLAWSNEQLVQTTHNTSSKLRSEWIPNSVLHLGCWGGLVLGWLVDGYSLFTVNRLSCCQVLGHKQILLSSGNVNSVVSVWFDYHLGAGTTFASASTASSSTGSSTSSTSSTSTTTGTTTSSKRTATSAKRTATGSSSGSPSESTTTSSAAASAASV
ncbi:hypothetical protein OGAPHI_000953 [Ogataea philodendri]|uniref:Uncharacterized protein n=1 Tax=Ogataea philodendri TaxID=1378263 RepID=A0A9P8PDU7_9ASCO|nr:uncharacterized protein OGAPHI_000953 [Ogataea philodendri]KAH3670438.1 hypothetical protein OGAPHI_000953 [Ogataea philodendri]